MRNLKIFPYNPKFPKVFESAKKKISKIVKNCEIHHIGSTAVPGLGGKGIIDIMIGIEKWQKAKEVINKLKSLGFSHIHPKEKDRIFASNKKESGFADIHLHIVKKGSKVYKDLLLFRDYLRGNEKEIAKFYKLKLKWQAQSQGDWKLYNKLKSEYVKGILKKAK